MNLFRHRDHSRMTSGIVRGEGPKGQTTLGGHHEGRRERQKWG